MIYVGWFFNNITYRNNEFKPENYLRWQSTNLLIWEQ